MIIISTFVYSFLFAAGEKIAGIAYNPESLQGMRENLERILQFMSAKRIRMHQISSKEILEGNLKAVMRLILALAAHYKPQSVRHHDATAVTTGTSATTTPATSNGYDNSARSTLAQSQVQKKNQVEPAKVNNTTYNIEGNKLPRVLSIIYLLFSARWTIVVNTAE